jgi:hypothetical protein
MDRPTRTATSSAHGHRDMRQHENHPVFSRCGEMTASGEVTDGLRLGLSHCPPMGHSLQDTVVVNGKTVSMNLSDVSPARRSHAAWRPDRRLGVRCRVRSTSPDAAQRPTHGAPCSAASMAAAIWCPSSARPTVSLAAYQQRLWPEVQRSQDGVNARARNSVVGIPMLAGNPPPSPWLHPRPTCAPA